MKYLQKLISRQFYRSPLFWALSLTATYSLAGFLLLPNIIHKTIVEQVEQQLGWKAEIEKVQFNPYTFTFLIDNLKISDQQAQEQLSFKRYYMNFELRSIIEGAFTFANIELLEPNIKVELDKNGVTNFQHAMQQQLEKNPVQAETPPPTESNGELVKLLFDNIDVIAGNIHIIDNTPAQPVEYQLNPITFTLKDLFTYGEKEGNYSLNIELGKEQSINWNGTIGISPLRSNGALVISGFRVHDFWDYLSEQVPYTLQSALVGFSGEYQLSMANEPMQLNVHQAMIQINDIKLANKQQEQSFTDIKAIDIGPFEFDLAKQNFQAEALKIDTLNLDIERNKEGLLNILAPFATSETEKTAQSEASEEVVESGSPFQWSIANIELTNSQVNFIDQQPSTEVEIAVNKINLNVQGVNQDLSKTLPFSLSYYIDQAGENKVDGQISPVPLNLQAHIILDKLALPSLQPYISDLAKVELEQGKLSVNGDLNLSTDAQEQIQGDFQGAFNIDEFNTKGQQLKQRLVGWQALAIDPIKVNFNPLNIAINKITLDKPYARVIITEDRSVNLSQLAVNNEQQTEAKDDDQQTKQQADKSEESTEQPLDIKIDNITITDGGAYFADLSLQPQFGTSIENINGEINGLSSNNLERADIDIRGSIEEYGKMLIKGKINPLSGDLYTDINVDFKKIELAALTPYSGRHIGYAIDKGKLNLALNYKIANNQLDSNNHLVLDKFELGQTVKSDEAIDLPLKLALALFKDRNGIIDISLPIKGDMDSPDFAIGGLAMQAFVNVLTKAVASPFSMIANLAGGDADKLNSIAFNLGDATLSDDHLAQLHTLAEVLNNRPNLILEIRAVVDEKQDGLALKEQKLLALLKESGAENNIEQQKRIPIMEQLLVQYNSQKELTAIQSTMQAETAAIENDPDESSKQQLITDKYEQSLQQTLLNKQPLSSLELTNLAQQRINIIKAELIQQDNVSDQQVFALQPSLKGKAEKESVETVFSLTAN